MNEENNKWLVVVNPKASIGKSEKDWPEIQQLLTSEGVDFDFVMTAYQGHAISLVRDSITEKGYKNIISVGGDGTNNEVINGIFTQVRFPTTEITMGTIPVGTGNDWRRTFNFPEGYPQLVEIIKNGHVFPHDVGKVAYYNDGDAKVRYFLNAAGTGLNEMVCNRTNKLKSEGKGGSVRYMLNTASCLFQFKCVRIKLEIDDQEVLEDEILSISVGNCRFNGGGMMMMPHAFPDDGLFDITVVKKVGMLKFAANISNIYDGTFVDKLKEVSLYRGKKIRITSIPAHQLLLETEGETLTNSPFEFEMLPKAINMVVPEEVENGKRKVENIK
ncbi:MAG: diacylglycerol kinase family lipid kinase [Bacteroidales bacterium]|nr:diacylglycerol kinase family lipid kinase [Bacteroidales bacterium]